MAWLGRGVTVLDSTVLGRWMSSFIVVVVTGFIVVATLIVVVYNLDLVSSYRHADSLPPSFQPRQIRYHLSPVGDAYFYLKTPVLKFSISTQTFESTSQSGYR